MKMYHEGFFGQHGWFPRRIGFCPFLSLRRGVRYSTLGLIVSPALLLLIFCIVVSGIPAIAGQELENNTYYGTGAGDSNTGSYDSFFGAGAGTANTDGSSNSFFGYEAGKTNTTGYNNSFFGYETGSGNTIGHSNSFFGVCAGQNNTDGYENSFFGNLAGSSNTEGNDNSFFGQKAGSGNTTGDYNSFFGCSAGESNTTGAADSFFGMGAGGVNTTGYQNSFFGTNAGGANTEGNDNSFFGTGTGGSNTTGYENSFFGIGSGGANTEGNDNSFFGTGAGISNTVESFNTFVGSNADLNPGANPETSPVTNATAIGTDAYVSQSNSLVLGSIKGVNGAVANVNVGIGVSNPARQLHLRGDEAVFRMDRSTDTAAFMLVRTNASGTAVLKVFAVGTNASGSNNGEFVINDMGTAAWGGGNRRMTIRNNGNIVFTGTVTAADFITPSSLVLKTNVRTYENPLETVKRLRGVRFDWKDSGKPSVGLIAEEVEGVVPEVVAPAGGDGTAKGVNYASLVGVLVEAVKEQQSELDGLKAEVQQLKALLLKR